MKKLKKINFTEYELPSSTDDNVVDAILTLKDKLNELVEMVNFLLDNQKK